jgi:DNA modification methylase
MKRNFFNAHSKSRLAKADFQCVESVRIGRLKPNPRNPRTHSNKQINRIRESIEKQGFLNPIIVDEEYTVLGGHGRLEAARRAGLSHVPVLRYDHLTPAQKRAYLIADNRIAEQAGWDRQLLAVELAELSELLPAQGFDVSLTGFEAAEIDLLIADIVPKPEPEDTLPLAPDNPVTKLGDLWQLGNHRLFCADAQQPQNFKTLMNGNLAAAVFCDPPYNVRPRTIGGRGRIKHPGFAFASGEMDQSQFREFLSTTLTNGIRVSSGGAIHFVCMDWRHIGDLIEVGRDIYDAMLNLVVWNKSNAGQGSLYRSQHELIGVFRVGDHPHRNNIELGRFGRNRSNVWTYAGANTFGLDRMKTLASHPTVKPVALVADALLDCTQRGDVVLDQFCGSGTIIMAAEKVGRTAYAMEYEPRYVDVAIERWQSLTKLEATLAGDGGTFEEIAEARANRARAPESPGANARSAAKRSRQPRRSVRVVAEPKSNSKEETVKKGRRHA